MLAPEPAGARTDLPPSNVDALAAIQGGGRRAIGRALTDIERRFDAMAPVLDAALADRRAMTLGLTGPPGAGKSSLLGALIHRWRTAGETVGVIAVDPSSRRTGGAVLGDRLRLHIDGEDPGLFVRSMAARCALGGVANLTLPSLVLLAAVFDRVVVETVGVGQSETDVRDLVDTVVLCVPPQSGDMIQFMKAGIVEIPDIIAVTKADVGAAALRAMSDIQAAMDAGGANEKRATVLAVSALTGTGLDALSSIPPHGLGPSRNLGRIAWSWARRRAFDAALEHELADGQDIDPRRLHRPFSQARSAGPDRTLRMPLGY